MASCSIKFFNLLLVNVKKEKMKKDNFKLSVRRPQTLSLKFILMTGWSEHVNDEGRGGFIIPAHFVEFFTAGIYKMRRAQFRFAGILTCGLPINDREP